MRHRARQACLREALHDASTGGRADFRFAAAGNAFALADLSKLLRLPGGFDAGQIRRREQDGDRIG